MKFKEFILEQITTSDINVNPNSIDFDFGDWDGDGDSDEWDDSESSDILAHKWASKIFKKKYSKKDKERILRKKRKTKNLLDIETKDYGDVFSDWKEWLSYQDNISSLEDFYFNVRNYKYKDIKKDG